MPALADPKKEMFAQQVVIGQNLVTAHKTAGFSGNRGNASTLKQDKAVAARIEELTKLRNAQEPRALFAADRAVMLTGVTKAHVIQMLMEDRKDAKAEGQHGVALRAAELIGIEIGMFVKRSVNKHEVTERRFSDMTPEEQDAAAAELLARARAVIDQAKLIEGEAVEVEEG